jgi:hypothetical protein
MKLNRVLRVSGEVIQIVSENIRLDLHSPGRAVFTVQSAEPLRGLVTFNIGYNDQALQDHFIGYVESCTAAGAGQQVLLCRELAAVLAQPTPLNLRHTDLRGVLDALQELTGLTFNCPDRPYSTTPAPYFYNLGNGYHALDSLAHVFAVPDLIWQQQSNGEMYVGSWADSFWSTRPLPLPASIFDDYQGNQTAQIPALPGVRPGATFNGGLRITTVTLAGNKMAIKWKKQSAAA